MIVISLWRFYLLAILIILFQQTKFSNVAFLLLTWFNYNPSIDK